MKETLEQNPIRANLETAYDQFFYERLKTRYLDPIELLDKDKIWKGEGSSILTIICSLIEFLQATYDGKEYFYSCSDTEYDSRKHYKDSGKIFKKFLRTQPPFSEEFNKDPKLPNEFYVEVRNGLLHEAKLKGKWRIHAYEHKSDKIIDKVTYQNRWIIYRANLKKAIYSYLVWYREEVLSNQERRKAFMAKVDSFCFE